MKLIIPELVSFLLQIPGPQNAMAIHKADKVLVEQKKDAVGGKSFDPTVKKGSEFFHPNLEIKAVLPEATSEEEDSRTVAGFFFGAILSEFLYAQEFEI
ncbi:unnamed protein product [Prunus armeniaca]|uniref:Uncharacterized protein n=1 Tax=Prunus armeniaca TaxID=36596 RepID=A0A6J5UBS0_PRUAR|nr:unnamed protein product [Prunus armeniaca]